MHVCRWEEKLQSSVCKDMIQREWINQSYEQQTNTYNFRKSFVVECSRWIIAIVCNILHKMIHTIVILRNESTTILNCRRIIIIRFRKNTLLFLSILATCSLLQDIYLYHFLDVICHWLPFDIPWWSYNLFSKFFLCCQLPSFVISLWLSNSRYLVQSNLTIPETYFRSTSFSLSLDNSLLIHWEH